MENLSLLQELHIDTKIKKGNLPIIEIEILNQIGSLFSRLFKKNSKNLKTLSFQNNILPKNAIKLPSLFPKLTKLVLSGVIPVSSPNEILI